VHKKGFINIGIVLAIIVLLGVGSYYVATRNAEAPVTNENQQNVNVPAETATDEKYRNDKFGFEISTKDVVAEEVDLFALGVVGYENELSVVFEEKPPCDNTTGCRWGRIEVGRPDPNYTTLQSIKNDKSDGSDTEHDYSITWGPDITIGGQPAIKGITREGGIPVAYVIYNGNLYRFARELILDKNILSTFKFTQ